MKDIESAGEPLRILTLVTAAHPERCDWLKAASESVTECRNTLAVTGWQLEWVICFDVPSPALDTSYADVVLELSKHSGTSAARNIALSQSNGSWVLPYDADDTLDVNGLRSLTARLATVPGNVGWVAANRTFLQGGRTRHWNDQPVIYPVGSLASNWSAPFPFHPNTVAARRDLVLLIGGWPVLPSNEDMAWVLLLSETMDGIQVTDSIVNYRVWENQEVSTTNYVTNKALAFPLIEAIINNVRLACGREMIVDPLPGPAFGIEASNA